MLQTTYIMKKNIFVISLLAMMVLSVQAKVRMDSGW